MHEDAVNDATKVSREDPLQRYARPFFVASNLQHVTRTKYQTRNNLSALRNAEQRVPLLHYSSLCLNVETHLSIIGPPCHP